MLARAAAASSAETLVSRKAAAAADTAAASLAVSRPSKGAAGSVPSRRLAAALGTFSIVWAREAILSDGQLS